MEKARLGPSYFDPNAKLPSQRGDISPERALALHVDRKQPDLGSASELGQEVEGPRIHIGIAYTDLSREPAEDFLCGPDTAERRGWIDQGDGVRWSGDRIDTGLEDLEDIFAVSPTPNHRLPMVRPQDSMRTLSRDVNPELVSEDRADLSRLQRILAAVLSHPEDPEDPFKVFIKRPETWVRAEIS